MPNQVYYFITGTDYKGMKRISGLSWSDLDEVFLRILGAFLLFVQDKIIVVAGTAKANRASQRRVQALQDKARSQKVLVEDVKIVTLRSKKYVGHKPPEGESGREYSVRWMVRGHWRQQWYPSKGYHQAVWIAPYQKGPEDAPLKLPRRTLYAVAR